MAKRPKIEPGDLVWVLATVTRVQEGAEGAVEVTVQLPNGNKATLRFDPDDVKPADQ